MEPENVEGRFELAKLAYGEVLDATKHQDDKIGRILGAVAFFTAGVIAFLDKGALSGRYVFGDLEAPLVALALGAFLVFASLSALLFVLATTSALTLPRRSTAPVTEESPVKSHIFFLEIASYDGLAWQQAWEGDQLRHSITNEFIHESRNLAGRAASKYRRSQEATALLLIAMPFFALTVVLALDVLADDKINHLMEWTPWRRAVVATTLSLFAGLFVFFASVRSARRLRLLLAALPTFVFVTIVAGSQCYWLLALALLGIVLLTQAWKLARTEGGNAAEKRSRTAEWLTVVIVVVTVTGIVLAAWRENKLVQLSIGALIVTALPSQELLKAAIGAFRRPKSADVTPTPIESAADGGKVDS